MKESPSNNHQEEPPPVFGSWRRVYWFVAVFFFVEVIAFYIFTRIYS